MEVGQVIRVVGAPSPPHGPGEAYRIPVRVQRGTYQVLLDSGCMQTMVHQRLVRPGVLVEASRVLVRCVHGDVHEIPLVPIKFSTWVKHIESRRWLGCDPLVLGLDWVSTGG